MKRLATWNVNGIRACLGKGFLDWMSKEKFDIVCLNETKANVEQLPQELTHMEDYYSYYASAQKKGYSGVAIFSSKKYPEPKITVGLGVEKFDSEGRTLIAEYDDFILFAAYFPNGQEDHARVPYKLEFSRTLAKLAKDLQKKKKKPVIICGDVNTAHTEIDLTHPKANKDSTGFLPIEREWVDEVLSQGFLDAFRLKHPDEPKQYTWWSYRMSARAKNVGWRIDYFLVSDDIKDQITDCYHQPQVMGSDHCPVVLELN